MILMLYLSLFTAYFVKQLLDLNASRLLHLLQPQPVLIMLGILQQMAHIMSGCELSHRLGCFRRFFA